MSLRRQLATFGFDLAVPAAIYYLLHALGVSNLVALGAGAVVPAAGVLYQLAARRHTDGVGLVVVATVAASIIMSAATRDPRFLLARDGLITGLWGAWFLASVAARRPAAYILARPLMEGRRVFAAGSWEALWQTEPRFRRIWRVASVMWGAGLLADAAVRVVMSYTLPVHVVPGLSVPLWVATFVVIQIATNTYYNAAGLYRILGARWIRARQARRGGHGRRRHRARRPCRPARCRDHHRHQDRAGLPAPSRRRRSHPGPGQIHGPAVTTHPEGRLMRARGINYDTGFSPAGRNSRQWFDPELVRHEMGVIAAELHCTAVRITGGDPGRLAVAAGHAAAAGLEVWFAPFPCEMTTQDMLPYFADCAARAETIRRAGTEVVFVMGCEVSMFAVGFLPGRTALDRLANLSSGAGGVWVTLGQVTAQLDGFLAEAARVVRERFGGKVTYAAAPWESIDWTPFDIVAVDAYRSARNAASFREEIRGCSGYGKPVAVTEFGTCAYAGAADRGGMAWAVLDQNADTPRLTEQLVRDEDEQVRYLNDLLAIFSEEGVDAAFWFTFAAYELLHHLDPARDLDLASYGLVKMTDRTHWEPKAAFQAMADAYARLP